jgi:hypothetical protein
MTAVVLPVKFCKKLLALQGPSTHARQAVHHCAPLQLSRPSGMTLAFMAYLEKYGVPMSLHHVGGSMPVWLVNVRL